MRGAYASVTLIMLFLPLKPWNRLLAGAVLELLATVGFLIAAVLKPCLGELREKVFKPFPKAA